MPLVPPISLPASVIALVVRYTLGKDPWDSELTPLDFYLIGGPFGEYVKTCTGLWRKHREALTYEWPFFNIDSVDFVRKYVAELRFKAETRCRLMELAPGPTYEAQLEAFTNYAANISVRYRVRCALKLLVWSSNLDSLHRHMAHNLIQAIDIQDSVGLLQQALDKNNAGLIVHTLVRFGPQYRWPRKFPVDTAESQLLFVEGRLAIVDGQLVSVQPNNFHFKKMTDTIKAMQQCRALNRMNRTDNSNCVNGDAGIGAMDGGRYSSSPNPGAILEGSVNNSIKDLVNMVYNLCHPDPEADLALSYSTYAPTLDAVHSTTTCLYLPPLYLAGVFMLLCKQVLRQPCGLLRHPESDDVYVSLGPQSQLRDLWLVDFNDALALVKPATLLFSESKRPIMIDGREYARMLLNRQLRAKLVQQVRSSSRQSLLTIQDTKFGSLRAFPAIYGTPADSIGPLEPYLSVFVLGMLAPTAVMAHNYEATKTDEMDFAILQSPRVQAALTEAERLLFSRHRPIRFTEPEYSLERTGVHCPGSWTRETTKHICTYYATRLAARFWLPVPAVLRTVQGLVDDHHGQAICQAHVRLFRHNFRLSFGLTPRVEPANPVRTRKWSLKWLSSSSAPQVAGQLVTFRASENHSDPVMAVLLTAVLTLTSPCPSFVDHEYFVNYVKRNMQAQLIAHKIDARHCSRAQFCLVLCLPSHASDAIFDCWLRPCVFPYTGPVPQLGLGLGLYVKTVGKPCELQDHFAASVRHYEEHQSPSS